MATKLLPWLMILSIVSGGLCQLVFRDSPATTTVLVGYPTILRCSARDPAPPSNVVWRKDGVTVNSESRITTTYDAAAGDSELRISPVSYVDAGGYQCLAVGSSDQILAVSSIGTLTVHGHPEFARPLPSLTVAEGDRAEFNCDIFSVPAATAVNWSYESGGSQRNLTSGGRITISPSTSLIISNVQRSDDGYYICTAENSFGRNSTSGRLTVGTPPPPLSLSVSPDSPVTVVHGDHLVLTCSAPDNIHLTSIQWMRGTNIFTTGITRTTNSLSLTVNNIRIEDGGSYVCSAEDSFGERATLTTVVMVDVPPQITVPPANLTVVENTFLSSPPSCQATGEPTPTYAWFGPDGSLLPFISGVPQFGILTRSSSGSYACVASNRVGQARSEFTITVEGPPLFTVTPTDVSTSFGRDVTFRCEAVGPPEPTYAWTRIGRQLPDGAVAIGTTLNLFSVSAEDAGVYQCTAGNARGVVNSQATLTVLAPPSITQATTSPIYTLVGSPFTLDCVWTGPPNSIQSWYLNGTLLSPSSDFRLQTWPNGSLTVSNPTESYTGTYMCNVSTPFQFVTSQVLVTVGEPPRIRISPSSADLSPGSSTFLSCVPNGFPQPWTTWFKTDIFGVRSQLPNFGTTFTKFSDGLQLHDVSREDSGMYECRVENRLGSMEQDAMVRVEGAPEASGVESVTLAEGAVNSNISCLTLFNFPAGMVTWSRTDGQPLPTSRFSVSSTGQLIIANVLRQDSGEYSCVVQNQYGMSSASGSISVNYAPSINIPSPTFTATLGQTFVLSCPAEGQPTPTVQWTPPDGLNPNSYRMEANGDLTVFSAVAQSMGPYTCMATNSVGSMSSQIEVVVRGFPVAALTLTVLSTTSIFALWTPQTTPQSYELEVRAFDAPQLPVMEFTAGGTTRSRNVMNLAPGKRYNFTIRPIYENEIPGNELSMVESTREAAPSGPPQNVMVQSLAEAFYITWEEPAFDEQGGTVLTYDIYYRFETIIPETGPPFMSVLDIPNSALASSPGNSSGRVQTYMLSELIGDQSYEVKIRAVTAVGPGPNSTLVISTARPPRSYQHLDLDATRLAIIIVGVFFCGVSIIAILVLLIGILVYTVRKRVKMTGKHETLVEEEEYERRQRKREKRKKIISDPIPGMVEETDRKKLSLKSKEGKILARPKVVRQEDMAEKPKPGKNVKKVPRSDTLISQDEDDEDVESQYDDPADVVEETYDEDEGIRKQKSTKGSKVKVVHQPDDDVYEDVEMGGASGSDDESNQVYASVSADHKAKKRMKMLEQQQKEDLKEEKKRRKMEEKMERETRKKEERDRKAAEKKRKEQEKKKSKLSKEEQRRQSLGLGNIVRLQDVDFGSGDAKAQAEFIDSATAALF